MRQDVTYWRLLNRTTVTVQIIKLNFDKESPGAEKLTCCSACGLATAYS